MRLTELLSPEYLEHSFIYELQQIHYALFYKFIINGEVIEIAYKLEGKEPCLYRIKYVELNNEFQDLDNTLFDVLEF